MTLTDKLREVVEEVAYALTHSEQGVYEKNKSWLESKLFPLLRLALLSERTRLEGLLPEEKDEHTEEDISDGEAQRMSGFNACLHEVREKVFVKN